MKKKIESDDEDVIRRLYEPTPIEKLRREVNTYYVPNENESKETPLKGQWIDEDEEEKRLQNFYAPKPPLPLSEVEKLYLPSYVPPKPVSVYDPSDRPLRMAEFLE
jgi:hypothetical protein